MKIVYYYVLYLKTKRSKEKIEIHLDPFETEAKAQEYKKKCDARYGESVYWSGIKKVDLSKHEKGIWLK